MNPQNIIERIGCSTLSFHQSSIIDAIEQINAFHIKNIDIGVSRKFCPHIDVLTITQSQIDRIIESLKRYGISVSTLNVSFSGLAIIDAADLLEYVRRCIKIAVQLKAYSITLPSPPKVKDQFWKIKFDDFVKTAKGFIPIAQENGLPITIEAPHSNTLFESCDQTSALFNELDNEWIKCAFDTSHAQRNDRIELKDWIPRLHDKIYHVHLRDSYAMNYILTPGKGICKFDDFIRSLDERGYKGNYVLELETENMDIKTEIDFSLRYFKTLFGLIKDTGEFAIWKNEKFQKRNLVKDVLKHPKAYIMSNQNMREIISPVAQYVKKNFPRFMTRYEMKWNRVFSLHGNNQVPFKSGMKKKGSNRIRVGVLGCGNIGYNMQIPAFGRLPNVELVGVADVNPENALKASKRYKCRYFLSLEEMIQKAKPDLIANCTNEWAHHDTTMTCMKAGIDVFCEKIMAESVMSGSEMVDFAKQNNRVLAVNYNWRFLPGISKIKTVLDEELLGQLHMIKMTCHAWVWNHALDLAIFLGGKIVRCVSSIKNIDSFHDRKPWKRFSNEVLYLPTTYATAILETDKNVGINIACSEIWDPNSLLFSIDILCEKGVMTLSGIHSHDATGIITSNNKIIDKLLNSNRHHYKFAITFQNAIASFVHAYSLKARVPVSGEDGLEAIKLENMIVRESVGKPT